MIEYCAYLFGATFFLSLVALLISLIVYIVRITIDMWNHKIE